MNQSFAQVPKHKSARVGFEYKSGMTDNGIPKSKSERSKGELANQNLVEHNKLSNRNQVQDVSIFNPYSSTIKILILQNEYESIELIGPKARFHIKLKNSATIYTKKDNEGICVYGVQKNKEYALKYNYDSECYEINQF
jgi:hypothetical protein